jgi:hypothetical protein
MFRRDRKKDTNSSALREWAGVIAALIAVFAFVNMGYVLVFIEVFTDKKISVNEAWSSGLISISSAALGFLIGKQSTATSDTTISSRPSPAPPDPFPLPSTQMGCNMPGCPLKEPPAYETN